MSQIPPIEYYTTQLPDIPNVVYEDSNAYCVTADTMNRELLKRILHSFRPEDALYFFDKDYFKISDPGAYVTVHKSKNSFVYSLANHGWSSLGQTIHHFHLIRYILKSLSQYGELSIYPLRGGMAREQNRFYYEKQLTLIKVHQTVSLYEVNGSYLLKDILYSGEYFNVLLNEDQTIEYEEKGPIGLSQIIEEVLKNPLELIDNHMIIKKFG